MKENQKQEKVSLQNRPYYKYIMWLLDWGSWVAIGVVIIMAIKSKPSCSIEVCKQLNPSICSSGSYIANNISNLKW